MDHGGTQLRPPAMIPQAAVPHATPYLAFSAGTAAESGGAAGTKPAPAALLLLLNSGKHSSDHTSYECLGTAPGFRLSPHLSRMCDAERKTAKSLRSGSPHSLVLRVGGGGGGGDLAQVLAGIARVQNNT